MLETIRQFAEEQLVAGGSATEARAARARHFAGREAAVLALWDSPRQHEAYAWFAVELANLRSAFRWAADHHDIDVAAPIATYAALLGIAIENYEPTTWAEELIEPARTVDHPRLISLYAMAVMCYTAGRIDDAIRYTDACQVILARGRDEPPHGTAALFGAAYLGSGKPELSVEFFRSRLAHRGDTHVFLRIGPVFALATAGSAEEAVDATDGLIEAAEATSNPFMLALSGCGLALTEADPVRALDALRRGLVIAQGSGNRFSESILAMSLSRLEAEYGDPLDALDHLTLAIRNCHDSGNVTVIRNPLGILAVVLARLGRHESAATIAGFANNPITAVGSPAIGTTIADLRDQPYESLARKGETMTTAAMVTYAYDQIDQARAELNAVSK
jgi:hypothetical protein